MGGALVVITIYPLFLRVIYLAERQKQNLVGFMAVVAEFIHFFM
jgi:hypothetical protein